MTVGEVIAALAELPAEQPLDWSLGELETAIPALLGIEAQLACLRLEAVASFDAKGGGRALGMRSTADWLTKSTGVSHAGAMVHTARALRDELPATTAALARGAISEEQVRVIRQAHRMLGDDFTLIEAEVVTFAQRCTVKELRRFIDRIIQQYRPDDSDDGATVAREKRKAFLSRSMDGWWHLSGLLDPQTGERLAAALDVYAERTGDDDQRSRATRFADALGEIADKAVADLDRPSGRGQVVISLTADQMSSGLGVSWPHGGLLSRPDVERLTCSAQVAIVVGVDTAVGWELVNVGFTQRYATAAQRLALQVRDGDTCIHSGCTVHVNRCKAHHIVHWRDGGPTDLRNLAMLCEQHHVDVHAGTLIVVGEPGGYTTRRTRPA